MTAPLTYNSHISARFNAELEEIKNNLLEMGGKVESQIDLAAKGLTQGDSGKAEEAILIDRDINRMEVEIDEQCARILALRQPAASDLRLVISIAKVTTDLERIGDEATKVARIGIQLTGHPHDGAGQRQIGDIATHVSRMLGQALDAFARLSVESAVAVILSDRDIDTDYKSGVAELKDSTRKDPSKIDQNLDRVWALRSLERIGDHASNIAEQVVYLARGVDVRHIDNEGLQALLDD